MTDVELQDPKGDHKKEDKKEDKKNDKKKKTDSQYHASEDEIEKSRTIAKKHYEKEKYKNPGPIAKRRCQDICCLFLFLQYWIIMFIIAYYAFTIGNPQILIYGIDSQGNICNQNNKNGTDLVGKPYLFYFDLSSPSTSPSVCLAQCPNYTWVEDFSPPSLAICLYNVPQPTDNATLKDAIANGTCAPEIFVSTVVLNRCVPDASYYAANSTVANYEQQIISELNARDVSLEIQRDLYTSWKPILISVAVAAALSIFWLIFLQCCTGILVYTSIFAVVLTTAAAMLYLWYRYVQLSTGKSITQIDNLLSETDLNSYQYSETTYLVVAIIVTVFSGLLYLALIFLRRRIALAVTIIEISSKAVRAVPLIIFLPIVKVLLLGLVTAWFVFVMIYLSTAGTITQLNLDGYYTFQSDYTLQYLQLYYIFGYFWSWNLVLAIGDCTMAGVFGTWYWTKEKKNLPWFMILPSFYRVFRYHLGSLAFGSLIIAIVQFIRYLLYKLEKQLKGKESTILKVIFKLLQCFFLCLERFLKFLDRNAYIEIAVYGYSFCKACKWAFQLITRNVIRVVVVTKLGDFLMFLGKVIITTFTAIIGNILIEYYSTDPSYWITPMIVICFIGYGISYLFMAVTEMAVATIFLCFCEDLERNDGSAEKPYYMDPSLRKYIDKEVPKETKSEEK